MPTEEYGVFRIIFGIKNGDTGPGFISVKTRPSLLLARGTQIGIIYSYESAKKPCPVNLVFIFQTNTIRV